MDLLISFGKSLVESWQKKELTWSIVYVWYSAMFVLCLVGAVLHDVLFATKIWHEWALTTYTKGRFTLPPVWADSARATAGFLLSMLGLRWLDVNSDLRGQRINQLEFALYEWLLFAVAAAFAAFAAFQRLPASFFALCTDLVSHQIIAAVPFTPEQIQLSYVQYSPYTLSLWLGMVFPMFLLFVRSIQDDWRMLRTVSSSARVLPDYDAQNALDDVWLLWVRRYDLLKVIATHYFAAVVFIAVLLLLERYVFSTAATATGEALGGATLFAMFVLVLAVSALVVDWPYTRERARTEDWLRGFREHSMKPSKKFAASAKLKELESYSELDFLWAVVKSRGYTLTLCVSIAYVTVLNRLPNLGPPFAPQSAATAEPTHAPAPRPR